MSKKFNKIHNFINFNDINLDLKLVKLNKNKNYISLIKNNIERANYFNSDKKTKQNKELIKIRNISEKLRKSSKLKYSNKIQIINLQNKTISNIKLLKIYLNSLKVLNKNVNLNMKNNIINSILNNEIKFKYLHSQIKIDKIKNNNFNLNNNNILNKNQNNIVNVKNKRKSTILEFINSLKKKNLTSFNSKNISFNILKENKI